MQAFVALQNGRLGDAERDFKKFLRKEPEHFGALNLYAVLLMQSERFDDAEPVLKRAIVINSQSDKTFYNYGLVLKQLKKFEAARGAFSKSIALNSFSAETWNNRGTVFNDLRRYDEAIADFDRAISLSPNYAEALCNKGRSLFLAVRLPEAIAACNAALELKRDLSEAWIGLGDIHFKQRAYQNALSNYKKALLVKPESMEALIAAGHTFLKLTRYDQALEAFQQALNIEQKSGMAVAGEGHVMLALGHHDKALLLFERALSFDNTLAGAWFGLAEAHGVSGDWKAALTGYETAIRLKPDMDYALGGRAHAAFQICLWQGAKAAWAQCIEDVKKGLPVIDPFRFCSMPAGPGELLQCASNYLQDLALQSEQPLWGRDNSVYDRIRVAYISGDFRDHPVSVLLAGTLEYHNRSKFETIGISLTPDTPGAMRERIKTAFDQFHVVDQYSDQQIAELLHSMQVDIAVDLVGFSQFSRPGIFARRPCPVQINYLGYAGTMGTSYHDYIIADRNVIPQSDHEYYSECVACLPESFLPADNSRPISDLTMSRADADLPDDGFVFCSFNNTYKITPPIFDVWMRLLTNVEGSVLWLSSLNKAARENLKREAQARGVAPERLIFAPRMENPADHLARHQLADIFLDTLYYNAHTTASDALWAGLPLITCEGQTFASRVGSSLLRAVGLPELVTTSLEDYEALALKLARDPALLAGIKAKLAANRLTTPLFDTKRYTRHLEAAYVAMYERAQRGEPPESFAVEALPN